jgi:hypothetical protein
MTPNPHREAGAQFTPGRWYLASYGFDHVIGPCVAACEQGAVLAFRWGGPFRQKNYVPSLAIICEVPPPWHVRLFRRLFARGESA